MAYNTKPIKTDKDGNPISQYYNPNTDEYEPVQGAAGGNKVILYNEDGTPNNSLSLGEILDKLDQLKGTVIDEETRKQNEQTRQQNEQQRIDLYNTLKDLDVSQYELRLQKLEHDTSVEETVVEEAYGPVIPLPENVVNGQISVTAKGLTATNFVKNGKGDSTEGWWRQDQVTITEDGFYEIDTSDIVRARPRAKTFAGRKYLLTFVGRCISGSKYNLRCCLAKGGSAYEDVRTSKTTVILSLSDTELKRRYAILSPTDDGEAISIFRDASTGEEPTKYHIKEIMLFDVTDMEGTDEEIFNEINTKFPYYFSGTKSTFGAIRLKSDVGRNLAPIKDYSEDNQYQTVTKTNETFNGQPVYRAIKKSTGTPPTSMGSITTIRKGETFTASIWIKHEQQPTSEATRLIFYKNTTLKSGSAKNNYGEWERLIVTYTNNTDADIENVYIYFYPANGVGEVTYFTCPKIERGNKATEYDFYKESTLYILGRDEEGNILELRSLPNGVKDEVNISERKLIKRIEVKANVSSGTVINFADMAEGGTYYAWNDNGEIETGSKGDTLGIDATVLIYQLAEPIEMPVEVFGNLQSYENGTVYIDTIVSKVNFYDGQEGITVTVPIKAIDTLYKVDKETGYLHPLDISQAVIAEDRLSFTHPELTDGDLVDWDYEPALESTSPGISMKLPTNLKASVTSTLQGVQELSNKTKNLNTRVIANRRDIETLNESLFSHEESVDRKLLLKADKDYVDTQLATKVDKVAGKGLSTNDYTNEEKQKNQDNADNISDLQQELETHKAENSNIHKAFREGNIFFAHRGFSGYYPENTILSINKAQQYGFKGVEVDVRYTLDGDWVLMHDSTVDRTTNGTGVVSNLTTNYIKSLEIDGGNGV